MSVAVIAGKNLPVLLPILTAGLPGELVEAAAGVTDPAAVDIAVVDGPNPGALRAFPNVGIAVSLWAGVDHLLRDPDLAPSARITRLIDDNLTTAMVEAALAHVYAAHREHDRYHRAQREHTWRQHPFRAVADRPVGVLGLGTLGAAVAGRLTAAGFPVHAWARTPRDIPGVTVHRDLGHLLANAEILVVLLAATEQTAGILNRDTLGLLPRGAVVINLARAALVEHDDLLALLADGRLRHAVLDVHQTEPLPPDHPLWTNPRVDVFPHVAAPTDPRSAAREAVRTITAFRAGDPLPNLVRRTP